MIKNIIFDWSGVIGDDFQAVYHTAMALFEKHGVKKISFQEFLREWVQPHMVFYNKYMPGLDMATETVLYKAAYDIMAKKYPPKIFPGVKEVLKKFKKAGIDMIMISSNIKKHLLSDVEKAGLQGIFSEINSEVHDKAEDIRETIARNNFNPEETIFIGDTTNEVEAGKSGGTKTGAVIWGYNSEDKLKAANPDFIIHDLKELEEIILK